MMPPCAPFTRRFRAACAPIRLLIFCYDLSADAAMLHYADDDASPTLFIFAADFAAARRA